MSSEVLERPLEHAKSNNKLSKAVIVVHLYEQSAKMGELITVCEKYKVQLIEEVVDRG